MGRRHLKKRRGRWGGRCGVGRRWLSQSPPPVASASVLWRARVAEAVSGIGLEIKGASVEEHQSGRSIQIAGATVEFVIDACRVIRGAQRCMPVSKKSFKALGTSRLSAI